MRRADPSFDLAEVNTGLSSLREDWSRPWYRSGSHVLAQAVDAGITTALPLVATNFVAEAIRGAYSHHYSGYRDLEAPLFSGAPPNPQDNYMWGYTGALLGLTALSAVAGIVTDRGANFLSALGGRLEQAAGIVYAHTPRSFGRLAAETVTSAAASALLPGDRRYHPLVAAAVSGVTEGVLAAAARSKPDCQLLSPLRVPVGGELGILTRPLDVPDALAAVRNVVINAAMAGEHVMTNIGPCIGAIDKPVVGGDGRPSITVHGRAGGCEVQLISYTDACARTSFCETGDVRGMVPKGGTLSLSPCYPSSRELARMDEPMSRRGKCSGTSYNFGVRAKYPTGEARSLGDIRSAPSLNAAGGVGVSERFPPLHGPTMQVMSLPGDTVEVSGVGLANSTVSIVWPDKTRTSFDLPSSASGLQDFRVTSPGPQPVGLIELRTSREYTFEVALHTPFAGTHSSAEAHSRPFWKLGAVAGTAPLSVRLPTREAHTSAEVESLLSGAFSEYLRKLPGEHVGITAKESDRQRWEAECRNGLTALSKAIATHVKGESSEYAGRVYGSLIRQLVDAIGMHDTLGTALNKRPDHLSGVMASHLEQRTSAVAAATRQALIQDHGSMLRDVFRDGRTLQGLGWLDHFAQFTGKAADRIERPTGPRPSYRGLAGGQAAVR